MAPLRTIELSVLALVALTLAVSVGIYFWHTEFFYTTFAVEDGPVEYGTALFLLVAGLLLVRHSAALIQRRRSAAALVAVYALLFLAAAGEEISWGQRIFGWQAGDFFQQNNYQRETNFHNLEIAGFHLAKTLFGSVLTTVLLLYLVVLPLLYPRSAGLRRVMHRLAIPVPGPRHAVLAVAASVVVAVMDVPRKWEVYELVFSMIAVSIMLMPRNRATFHLGPDGNRAETP